MSQLNNKARTQSALSINANIATAVHINSAHYTAAHPILHDLPSCDE